MELTLIRHGESMADIEGRIEGSYDAPLSPRGRKQAEALCARLDSEDYQCDLLFSSPLSRACETARAVSEVVRLPVNIEPRLAEIDTGRLTGLKFEEARKQYPEPEGGRRVYQPMPGGESALVHSHRIAEFYLEMLDRFPEKRVCIVAHGGTLSSLLRLIYGLPMNHPDHRPRFLTGDTGVHRLDVQGPQNILTHYLNDCSHTRGI